MAQNGSFEEFILDQLADLGAFETKRMFGGLALLQQGAAFAKINHGKVWLKVDDQIRKKIEDWGMHAETGWKACGYKTPFEFRTCPEGLPFGKIKQKLKLAFGAGHGGFSKQLRVITT